MKLSDEEFYTRVNWVMIVLAIVGIISLGVIYG